MNEVVVTGLGIASPIGTTEAEFREKLFSGASGVRSILGKTVPADFPVPYAGLLPKNTRRSRLLRDLSVEPSDFVEVTALALEQVFDGMPEGLPVDAIVFGTGEGVGFDYVGRSLQGDFPTNANWEQLYSQNSANFISAQLARRGHGSLPPSQVISTYNACASGNVAIGFAFERIRSGKWKRAIVGSVDLRCSAPYLMSFHLLDALTTAAVPPEKASRPFSADRSGFVKGEGGALLLLENLDEASRRNAKIRGVVSGFSATSDGWRLTDGREDGRGAIAAMELAIRDAELAKERISYINAHGTSTPMNDVLETRAIKAVFGDRSRDIPVSSLKSQIGHSAVGCGAQEAVACLLMLEAQRLAPTINLDNPDPACDLDYVPHVSRAAKLEYILSNSFGFGGQNSCLVFKGAHLL